MSILERIRPSVCAVRLIASVQPDFKAKLGLPAHINSLGLLTADSDDVTYIAAARSMPARRMVHRPRRARY